VADAPSIVPRSEPLVLLRVKVDGADERVDLGDRLIGFTFEDSDNKTDKASIQIDNWDLFFFDSPLIVKGALLEVSWGYPDRMSPVRELVVRKVKGFTTLQVEAHAKSVLMNRIAMCRVFEDVTRADVARQIAEENGFSGAFAEIEDTEEVFESINQAGETDARFLTRLARREGFRFWVDQTGLHWHGRRFDQPPARVYRYFTDPNQGDILSVSLDNDVLAKPGRSRVRGRDARRRTSIDVSGSDADTPRDSLGDVIEVVDPETGTTTLDRRNATASVRSSAASSEGRARREANARFRSSSQKTVELKLQVVGDPEQLAKSIVEVQGISQFLSGKYYIKNVKHVLSSSGYTMELDCIKDATGRMARRVERARTSAGRSNRAAPRSRDELRPVDVVDPETGWTRVEYRRSS